MPRGRPPPGRGAPAPHRPRSVVRPPLVLSAPGGAGLLAGAGRRAAGVVLVPARARRGRGRGHGGGQLVTPVRELQLPGDEALREFVLGQRWFGAKSRDVAHFRVLETIPLTDQPLVLAILETEFL